jgi:hypothetical protein
MNANKHEYLIKIDKDVIPVTEEELSGAQILGLVKKTPEKYLLRQKVKGQVLPVEPADIINFATSGVERFMTVAKTVTDGDAAQSRREFTLTDEDAEYLDSLSLKWEAVKEGALRVVVIYGWSIASGFNTKVVDIHLRLSELYPDTHIDMAYFRPELARADARPINNLSTLQFDGKTWQQWSRHRTEESKWRSGEDNISTHMALVEDWLSAEVRK